MSVKLPMPNLRVLWSQTLCAVTLLAGLYFGLQAGGPQARAASRTENFQLLWNEALLTRLIELQVRSSVPVEISGSPAGSALSVFLPLEVDDSEQGRKNADLFREQLRRGSQWNGARPQINLPKISCKESPDLCCPRSEGQPQSPGRGVCPGTLRVSLPVDHPLFLRFELATHARVQGAVFQKLQLKLPSAPQESFQGQGFEAPPSPGVLRILDSVGLVELDGGNSNYSVFIENLGVETPLIKPEPEKMGHVFARLDGLRNLTMEKIFGKVRIYWDHPDPDAARILLNRTPVRRFPFECDWYRLDCPQIPALFTPSLSLSGS